MHRAVDNDEDWKDVAAWWEVDPETINLNHGSFGPPSRHVKAARRDWLDLMDAQPMEYFTRALEPAIRAARERLARFVGAEAGCLIPVDNATYGMNVVAHSFSLQHGDEVLLSDHEYGAVLRIWERACRVAGARLRVIQLPTTFSDLSQVVATYERAMTSHTRMCVVSHITSPTATIMPVGEICRVAKSKGIATCIDGPHAIAQLPLDLNQLGCDFYTASCHKWLSAGLGSGFLYVNRDWHASIEPPILSWGRLLPAQPESWDEEFLWRGTNNDTAFLTIPVAIDLLSQIGLVAFRDRTKFLATQAKVMLETELGQPPVHATDSDWYGCMSLVRLPSGDWSSLQQVLKEQDQIEIPVIHFQDEWFLRISCHLHTMTRHLQVLLDAVKRLVLAA